MEHTHTHTFIGIQTFIVGNGVQGGYLHAEPLQIKLFGGESRSLDTFPLSCSFIGFRGGWSGKGGGEKGGEEQSGGKRREKEEVRNEEDLLDGECEGHG